jgi:C4-dicarboxylate-specific signal transduction histidine kinase
MAEVATSVLHNVGNVLNSVNVSASIVADEVSQSKVTSLERLIELLRDHEQDLARFMDSDPKGKRIPSYLAQLTERLLAERDRNLKELESLRSNIEHIKRVVSMQQRYSRVSALKERTNLVELVEDALQMNEVSLHRHEIEIVRDYADVPMLEADKHKILQILVNLVRNAKDACTAAQRNDKRITVGVAMAAGAFKISVIDNGVGIEPQNMRQIFGHGFTTKKDGHGFGLHSSAIAARELGGALTAHSEGTDRGAAFTLDLPFEGLAQLHEPAARAAAR